MNGKQAKRLADKARRMSGGNRRSGIVSITHAAPVEPKKQGFLGKMLSLFKGKGLPMPPVPPSITIKNTGYRATYRNLKKVFVKIPRPQRGAWLDDAWQDTGEKEADLIAAAGEVSRAAHEVSKLAFPE